MKTCLDCKELKGVSLFSKDKHRHDGLYVYCKACVKIRGQKRYVENKDKIKATNKAWKDANKESYRAQQRAYSKVYKQTLDGKYTEYKGGATKRNYAFELTKEAFATYWQNPCHYCNSTIETIGLDRKDNSIGYIETNVVSCCKRCNRAKDTMTTEEYVTHCQRVMENACR
jgi:hypothetical protein